MSFRKRNVAVLPSSPQTSTSGPGSSDTAPSSASAKHTPSPPGIRPSPVDGRPTTSTGTPSLDALLAGHAGLALGQSLLIEEGGTTDFAGALLRYYAAEGVVQGHTVHVVGVGEQWGRELPGLAGVAGDGDTGAGGRSKEKDKMKIAWRYERLGEFGTGVAGSRATPAPDGLPKPERSPTTTDPSIPPAFCHAFDLTKRLTIPSPSLINFIPPPQPTPNVSPFQSILHNLSQNLSGSSPTVVHRIVIPTVLSPAMYPAHASQPHHILQFFHALRGLLRRYPNQATAMITLPLELYPRSTALTRWTEILSDGVMELTPFPYQVDAGSSLSTSGAATAQEEQPQGMFKIHRLPVFHERGGGGSGAAGLGDDLAFTVSRRKFVIKPFSLPPVEGDTMAQQGQAEGGAGGLNKSDIEF
ncbi:MAG: hypothetical protein M1833_006956 [Piccolia ochrophora]|nr:MAG: hypothetical protein M1833_006956 [Piccolia ochrophora]